MRILIVVDMQKDFIDGALGTPEAVAIVPSVIEKIKEYELSGDMIIYTKDTHFDDYLNTREGSKLPVPHCIKGTEGWQIHPALDGLRKTDAIDKVTFGSRDLIDVIGKEENVEEITFIGLCTDICVISNVMLVKAFFPEIPLTIDAKACAGVTPESHRTALASMKTVQVKIINE